MCHVCRDAVICLCDANEHRRAIIEPSMEINDVNKLAIVGLRRQEAHASCFAIIYADNERMEHVCVCAQVSV